ncbi:F-box protein SKIP28 [Andrographis paniculata]|uniref:F-box protein SKIP28 n=1 Tax=Andrographis paniculata TaxID=175694 RepID=UPI0021E80FD6|nr:F-box protein SKIP28 [Andrographis paniculata]
MAGCRDHFQNSSPSPPNEALFFVLPYLPLFELLAMSQVCKSLRYAVATDLLPWLEIVVCWPLNLRISDDILAGIASRAGGKLKTLALIGCTRITDDGLLRVVAQNPSITKLLLPGCTRLSPAGVITAAKLLAGNSHKLTTLAINGIYDIQRDDLDTLRSLIKPDNENQKTLYHKYKQSSLILPSTDRAIDVDVCPKCNQARMVFDCPKTPCPKRQQFKCRGCETCTARCVECGVCITASEEPEEAACNDTLCLDCWLQLPKCSFCNKPYCTQHADQQQNVAGSSGFLCDACHAEFF